MKIFAILALCLASLTAFHTFAEEGDDQVAVDEPKAEVTIDDFKVKLAPNGKWIEVKDIGWVFQPNEAAADANWQPYCDGGHWTYTDYGWVFQSDYAWSWACYHYGRWYRHANLSWVWVPDCHWGPSWVAWRSDGEHYGWAPLPPSCEFVADVGFRFNGLAVGFDCEFGLGEDDFCFVPCGFFLDIHLGGHRCHRDECHRFFRHTSIHRCGGFHNGRYVCAGFERREVVRVTHTRIEVHHFEAPRSIVHHEERHAQEHRREERHENRQEHREQRQENRQEHHEQRQEHREQQHQQHQEHHAAQPQHHSASPAPSHHR